MSLHIFARRAPDPRTRQFETIVLPHLPDALALARWLTGSSHDSEDVVQEACLRAFKSLDSYDGRNARAWLLSIVRNACFSWLAKNRPKDVVFVGTTTDLEDHETPSLAEVDIDHALIAAADRVLVASALTALPVQFREAIVLRDINGLSYKEMAAMLDVPIGTIMSRLARGRAKLAASVRRSQS